MLLVVAVVAIGAVVVWRAVPEARRRRAEEEGIDPFTFSGPDTPAAPSFSFQPATVREDLPPRPLSIARIAVTVALVAGALAGLAWAIGSFVNTQLARMLGS